MQCRRAIAGKNDGLMPLRQYSGSFLDTKEMGMDT